MLAPHVIPSTATQDAPRSNVEDDVLGRLADVRRGLGTEVGGAFDRLAARIRLFEGRRGEGYFSHPMALPVIDLPVWTCASLEARGHTIPEGLAIALAESAAVGYLGVRVEDDWFDEAIGDPGEVVMLAQALLARHQRILGRHVPASSGFWDVFEEVWAGYAEAMLFERRVHRGEVAPDAGAFRKVLARSRPLILPGAAALFVAGRGEDLPALDRAVSALAAAHQIFTDLLHAGRDSAHGNRTYVLSRIAPPPGSGSTPLGAALRDGRFDAVIADAHREIGVARAAALEIAMPDLVTFLDLRSAAMNDLHVRAVRALFGV